MNQNMNIILLVVLVGVVIFVIFTTIKGRKDSKKEKVKRYQEVRNQIKLYIAQKENRKNLRIEFEKVYARKGSEYKYRDVFDVVVQLIEPKTNKVAEVRAYEIEGLTTKIDKKNYKTEWVVNGQIDLAETRRRIGIAEKAIKLTPTEKKEMKIQERKCEKELKVKMRLDSKKDKQKNKTADKTVSKIERINVHSRNKFVPIRKKSEN